MIVRGSDGQEARAPTLSMAEARCRHLGGSPGPTDPASHPVSRCGFPAWLLGDAYQELGPGSTSGGSVVTSLQHIPILLIAVPISRVPSVF